MAQTMWPRIEHSLAEVEECQARALSIESLSEGLLHPPSLISRHPPLLWDVSLHVPGPMLVVSARLTQEPSGAFSNFISPIDKSSYVS